MAKEEVFFGINIDTGEAIKDFGTLKKRTKELKKELDGTKVGTKRFKELQTEITKNQGTIRRFNRELRETKSLATRVGQGVTTAFKRVGVAMAGAFAVSGIFQAVKNAVGVMMDFEQAIADVGAVSGATGEELKGLETSARELAKVSIFTAQQVAGLQLELAKLGFTSKEIQQSSSGIINLSTAFRIDLSQAAAVSASTLRAFGLDASEMTRVTDVMADSFASSALDINKFQESMKLVAPTSKSTGRSLEETTALLGVLADNGINGSIAGTQLRRVFIELNKQGLSLEDAMDKTANSTDKLGTATELVGVRGATALQIFASQSEKLKELREDFSDTSGTAAELAEKSGDTLQGAFKRLQSAYDELILKFSGSKGTIRDVVRSITDFINSIDEEDVKRFTSAIKNLFKVVSIGVKTWIAYKATIIATNLATKLYTASTVSARIASIAFSGGLKGVNRAMKLLNLTIKSNPIGLLVGGITTLISVMSLWQNEEEDIEKKVSKTNKSLESRKNIIDELTAQTPELSKAIEDLEDDIGWFDGGATEEQAEQLENLRKAALDAFLNSAAAYKDGLGSIDLFSLQNDAKDLTDKISDLEYQLEFFDAGDNKSNILGYLNTFKELLKAINREISSRGGKEDSLGLIQSLEDKLKELGKNLKQANTVKEISRIGEEIKAVNRELAFYKELSKGISDVGDDPEESDSFFNTFDEDSKDPMSIDEDPDIQFARLKRQEFLDNAAETTDGLIAEEKRLTESKRREADKLREINNQRLESTASLIGSTIQLLSRDEESRRKNAKLIKAFAIAEIAVNTQKALMNVEVNEKSPLFLPNLFTGGLAGLTVGAVQKIAIAAQGAASIATVASQKFAKGGILNGPSHAQGGIKTNLGELEGGEAVINKKSTAMFGGTLSAINEAGGGKKFARGGVLPTPSTITTPNDINKDILRALTNFNLSPTVSVVEINEAQTRISEIENNSTL